MPARSENSFYWVEAIEVFRTRGALKESSDDCRYGAGSPRFAPPRRQTAESVLQGARVQLQVQVSGRVVSGPHICQWHRTWSWLPVRAKVSTPLDTGKP